MFPWHRGHARGAALVACISLVPSCRTIKKEPMPPLADWPLQSPPRLADGFGPKGLPYASAEADEIHPRVVIPRFAFRPLSEAAIWRRIRRVTNFVTSVTILIKRSPTCQGSAHRNRHSATLLSLRFRTCFRTLSLHNSFPIYIALTTDIPNATFLPTCRPGVLAVILNMLTHQFFGCSAHSPER